jgi:hypothetical protein
MCRISSQPISYVFALGPLFGGVVAAIFGISAARKSLEDIADPLSKVDDEPART